MADFQTNVIELVVSNGIGGHNSRNALQTLESYKSNPDFVRTIANLAEAEQYPVDPRGLSENAQAAGWPLIRQVAAWVLKTCIVPGLSYDACAAAASAALTLVQDDQAQRSLQSAAAVVIARLTALNGVDWWAQNNLNLSSLLLDDMLVSSSVPRVMAALRCLQYLVEDAANCLGTAVGHIVNSVAHVATNNANFAVRGMAIQVLAAVYEFGTELDWTVEMLSDVQQGLCDGSPAVALAVSSALSTAEQLDSEAVVHCFRLASHLLDFLRFLETAESTGGQLDQVFAHWCASAVAALHADAEVAAEACNFIGAAHNNWETAGGYGTISNLVQCFNQYIEKLVDQLINCMIIKPAEEHEMLENDHWSKRDPYVRKRSSKKKRDEKDSPAAGDDDTCAEATLRNSACMTLESIAIVEPDRVCQRVVNNVGQYFESDDWRQREVGICALSTIWSGCQNNLIPHLEHLIPTVGRAVGNGEPGNGYHIATIAVSLWALSKFGEWAMLRNQAMYETIIECAMPCLTSSSKIVQLAAITFFRNTLNQCMAVDPIRGGPIANYLQQLVQKLGVCLPVYHSNNLSVLCVVAQMLVPLMGDHAVPQLLPIFKPELDRRLPLLQQTMHTRYSDADVRTSCDTDCFEVGAVTCAVYAAANADPQVSAAAAGELSTWLQVLAYAAQCQAQDDDTGLFLSPISLIASLIPAVDDGTLHGILTAQDNEALRLVLNVAAVVEDFDVRSAVCSLLFALLGRFGADIIPSADDIIQLLATFGTVQEHCGVVADSALVVTRLFESCQHTESMQRFAVVLARQVRGDTVDNEAMILLAQCVGIFMHTIPQCFDLKAVSETALALRRSANDDYKAQATNGIMAVISGYAGDGGSDANALAEAFASFVKLVFTWHEDSKLIEGLVPAVGNFLKNAKGHPVLSQVLEASLSVHNGNNTVPAAISSVRKLYRI
jgi:hypothetical protein